MDLFVDTALKGVSIALSSENNSFYFEKIDENAKGESLSKNLNMLLQEHHLKLDNIKRVMVTLGPGSFSGLRTGIAFCEGICFSGKRTLYGVSTLEAIECFASSEKSASIIKARTGYWYLRINQEEFFDSTEVVIDKLTTYNPEEIVLDDFAKNDSKFKSFFEMKNIKITNNTGKPLNLWKKLFSTHTPSVSQTANYIQPSYFEKLK